jgi:hypothetical protein
VAEPATKRVHATASVPAGILTMPIRIPDDLPARATLEAEGVVVMRDADAACWRASCRTAFRFRPAVRQKIHSSRRPNFPSHLCDE